jgi:hypothetical protein
MNYTVLLSFRLLLTEAFLLIALLTQGQSLPAAHPEAPKPSHPFAFSHFRLFVSGGAFYKHASLHHPGPLLDTKSFAGVFDGFLAFGLSYQHTPLLNPEMGYRVISYYDGDYVRNLGNPAVQRLVDAKEFTLANRFYVLEWHSLKPIRLSIGLGGIFSWMNRPNGPVSLETMTIVNPETNDRLTFTRNTYKHATSNFSLNADVQVELSLTKNIHVGLGIGYVKGFRKVLSAQTRYSFQGAPFSATKEFYGSGWYPFAKLMLSLK